MLDNNKTEKNRSLRFGINGSRPTVQKHSQNTRDNNNNNNDKCDLENRLGMDDVQADELIVEVADVTDGDAE